MAQKELNEFSEELKQRRIDQDISLEKIHNETKIDLRFLQAIESAEFEIMPQVYIRAFIKEYSKVVGLDPETVVKQYDSAKLGISQYKDSKTELHMKEELPEKKSATPIIENQKEEFEYNGNNVQKKFPLLYFVIGAVSIILIAIIYFLFIDTSSEDILVEKPYEAIVEETKERYEIPTKEEHEEKRIPQDSLRLEIKVTDASWFKVIVDKSVDNEFILQPNRSKVVYAKEEFNLIIGNSGGVSFSLNHNNLEFFGRPGQVRKVRIRSEGIVPFQLNEPVISNE